MLLLCLRPTLRRWIGSRALAWLWLAIVVRLLFPVPVPAPWPVSPLLSASAAPASSYHFRVSVAPADTPINSVIAAPTQHILPAQTHFWQDVLFFLWLLGALLSAIRLAHGWWTTRRWSARTLPADTHPGLQSCYLALPAELRRGVALRLTDDLDVPTLVGVFRPQIWLPRTLPATLTSAELRHVLLHELGHARRRDLLAQWLCSLACCLHWFNPLVWLLARLARTDRELACDAWVLACDAMRAEPATSYGLTLLKVVEGIHRRIPPALPAVSMAAGKRHLGLRVREIRAFYPVTPWRGVAALVVMTALVAALTLKGAVVASDPNEASPTPQTTPPSPSAPPANVSPIPASSTQPTLGPRIPPVQVEIESKFIEVAKSSALKLEKSVPRSSPVANVFHHVFAPFAASGSAVTPTVFRSSLVLPDDFQLLVRQLNQSKGVDLLSAPRVTTKSGQKATIEIIREFIYPTAFERGQDSAGQPRVTPTDFDKMNTGLTLEVNPTIEPKGDLIDLSITWKITNFEGFVDADGKPASGDDQKVPVKYPTFDTRSICTVASLSSGATVVFGMENKFIYVQNSIRTVTGEGKRKIGPEKEEERLLLVFVTATLVDPAGAPPAGNGGFKDHLSATAAPGIYKVDQQPPQPTKDSAQQSYGVPVPGKPGFVTSPYAPDAGYVDVHGFTRGQSVRDPYTGKMFLVP